MQCNASGVAVCTPVGASDARFLSQHLGISDSASPFPGAADCGSPSALSVAPEHTLLLLSTI